MTPTDRFISAVECIVCKRIHKADAESFFTIDGAILIGTQGGVYGPEGRSYFCCDCLIKELENKSLKRLKKPFHKDIN